MLHMDVYDLQRVLCKETPCVPCERLFVEGVQVNLVNRGGLVIIAFPNLEAYREDYLYSCPCPKYSQMSCLATTSAKPTVHSEMYTRYLRIRPKLIDVIDDLYGFTSINVVGDRFGGALAQMCALDLAYQYIFVPIVCILFSPSRVGTSYFCYLCREKFNSCLFTLKGETAQNYPSSLFYSHIGPFENLESTESDWFTPLMR
jgi:Lipase (class 3)